MIDDTIPQEPGLRDDPPQSAGQTPASEDDFQPSIVRTRVIPAIAGVLLATIIGLILWSMFAPESARQQSNRQVGGAIVLEDPELVDDFELEPLGGGEMVSLSDYRGKVVVLNFWASWCQPCVREIPILMQASNEFDSDTVLIGINTLDDTGEAIAMMNEFNMNYLSLNDSDGGGDSVSVDFGVVGVPETYVINASGELIAFRRGDFTSTQDIHDLVDLAK